MSRIWHPVDSVCSLFWGFTERPDFWGVSQKKQCRRGDCLKRGAWTVCRFMGGGLGKEEGGVFEGGLFLREGEGLNPKAHYGGVWQDKCSANFKRQLECCIKINLFQSLIFLKKNSFTTVLTVFY